jgi:hypothetical protein
MVKSNTGDGNGRPLVTVIVPCYKVEKYLEDALGSVAAQTYPHWECVIVDDGSPDASAEIAARWVARDTRFRLIRKANGGLPRARNSGLAEAKGDWIVFLDADDALKPEFMQALLDRAQETRADLVFAGVAFVDEALNHLYDLPAARLVDPFAMLARRGWFPPVAVMVQRAATDVAGGFDPDVMSCEDLDYWLRLARLGFRFARVNRTLGVYRCRPGSLSRDLSVMMQTFVKVLRPAYGPDPRLPPGRDVFPAGVPATAWNDALAPEILHKGGGAIAMGQDPTGFWQHLQPQPGWALDGVGCGALIRDGVIYALVNSEAEVRSRWPSFVPQVDKFIDGLQPQVNAARPIALLRAATHAHGLGARAIETPKRIGSVLVAGLDLSQTVGAIDAGGADLVLAVGHLDERLVAMEVLTADAAADPRRVQAAMAHGLDRSAVRPLFSKVLKRSPFAGLKAFATAFRAVGAPKQKLLTGMEHVVRAWIAGGGLSGALRNDLDGVFVLIGAEKAAKAAPAQVKALQSTGVAFQVGVDGAPIGPNAPLWDALAELAVQPVIFVPTSHDRWSPSAWAKVAARGAKLGWRVSPEANPAALDTPDALRVIASAAEHLTALSGSAPVAALLPPGGEDGLVRTALREAGFMFAVTAEEGGYWEGGDPFRRGRQTLRAEETPETLVARLTI